MIKLKGDGLQYLGDDDMCFACGSKNPIGLKLKFNFNEEETILSTDFILHKNYQGFTDVVHGGIIATILDEVMTNLVLHLGFPAMTARMEIRYKKPMYVNTFAHAMAKLLERKKRIVRCESQIFDDGNKIYAEAIGVFFIIE